MKECLKKIWTGPMSGDPSPLIYLSGIVGGGKTETALRERPDIVRYQCISYYYMDIRSPEKNRELLGIFKKYKTRCFLDSGAFSYQMRALQKKQPLTQDTAAKIIDRYVDWIYATDFVWDFLATFDYSRDAKVTEWATKRIEKRGLHPVPVFHLGSSVRELEALIDHGYSLIGIGGMIPYRAARARPFLDHVFNLTEKRGVRCHGFGIGGQVIFKYPWFSVDTTAWLYPAKLGQVLRVSKDPKKFADVVTVSSRTATVRSTDPNHDSRDGRIVENWHYYNKIIDTLCSPAKTPNSPRKALF